jgi:hypothetical protein
LTAARPAGVTIQAIRRGSKATSPQAAELLRQSKHELSKIDFEIIDNAF